MAVAFAVNAAREEASRVSARKSLAVCLQERAGVGAVHHGPGVCVFTFVCNSSV